MIAYLVIEQGNKRVQNTPTHHSPHLKTAAQIFNYWIKKLNSSIIKTSEYIGYFGERTEQKLVGVGI